MSSGDVMSLQTSKKNSLIGKKKKKREEFIEPIKEKKILSLSYSLNNIKTSKSENKIIKKDKKILDTKSPNSQFRFETIESIDKKFDKKSSNMKTSKDNSNDYSDSYNIIIKELKILKKIDEGAYGEVKLAKYQGNKVALKYYKKNGKAQEQIIEEFTKEIKALDQLRHPNILFYMGYFYEKNNFVMVSQYASKGSLYNLLHKKKENLSEEDIIRIIKQIVGAMIYTHSTLNFNSTLI